MNKKSKPSKELCLLALAAFLVGILLGGYPNYSIKDLRGGSAAARPAVYRIDEPAHRRASACFEKGFALVQELREPSPRSTGRPLYLHCDRSEGSFFSTGLLELEAALARVRGDNEASCRALTAAQHDCVQRYVDFVETQVQFCAELDGDLRRATVHSDTEGVAPSRAYAQSYTSYCRCLAGALHASVSWISAPMPEVVPAGAPRPFGEGCGIAVEETQLR